MRVCKVDGCVERGTSLGMCRRHYGRWRRYGDPLRVGNTQGMDLLGKLEFYGWVVTEEGCWEWSGNKFTNGYGQLYVAGRKALTHKLSYELWVGPIPEGHIVRHKCDNRPCLNPDHLETGTQQDNHDDKWKRGRGLRGEASPSAKLKTEDVLEIRRCIAMGESRKSLSLRFGVTTGAIHSILSGTNWSHI